VLPGTRQGLGGVDDHRVIFTAFEDGRVVRDREIFDALGMLTQLGAFPEA